MTGWAHSLPAAAEDLPSTEIRPAEDASVRTQHPLAVAFRTDLRCTIWAAWFPPVID